MRGASAGGIAARSVLKAQLERAAPSPSDRQRRQSAVGGWRPSGGSEGVRGCRPGRHRGGRRRGCVAPLAPLLPGRALEQGRGRRYRIACVVNRGGRAEHEDLS